jgi:Rod binding domain-containing protein
MLPALSNDLLPPAFSALVADRLTAPHSREAAPHTADRSDHRARGVPDAALASEQFEGVFLSMLIKSMRTTMTEGELFGGDTADIWGGVFDQQLGEMLARHGGLGLMEQLGGADALVS